MELSHTSQLAVYMPVVCIFMLGIALAFASKDVHVQAFAVNMPLLVAVMELIFVENTPGSAADAAGEIARVQSFALVGVAVTITLIRFIIPAIPAGVRWFRRFVYVTRRRFTSS